MILQVIEKNPVKIVTNEKMKKKILTKHTKVSHKPLETFYSITNLGKEHLNKLNWEPQEVISEWFLCDNSHLKSQYFKEQ